MQLNENYSFEIFKAELRKRLQKWEPRSLDFEGLRRSAVKILLMEKNNEPHVLLTKRTDKVRTHKGQISFPGGGYDETDDSILNTAYRETFEEVGIPEESIEFIGQFDDYVSIFGHHVSCFVGSVPYPVEYNFSRDEIDVHIEAPLRIFAELQYDRIEKYNHDGKEFSVYYYHFQDHEIWGLTARILTDFARKVLKD